MRNRDRADVSAAAVRTLVVLSGSSLPRRPFLLTTFAFTAIAWWAAAAAWSAGQRGLALGALLCGFALGPCLTAYVTAPKATRPPLQRLVLISGGLALLSPALIRGTSLDLEGFFALLLAGAVARRSAPRCVQ